MVLVIHSVAGTFAMDGKTVELARKTDRKIADVDHFLHFAQTFLIAFSHFVGNQFSEWFFEPSQFISKLAHNFTALWCWFQSPSFKGFGGCGHYFFIIFFGSGLYFRNKLGINRRKGSDFLSV